MFENYLSFTRSRLRFSSCVIALSISQFLTSPASFAIDTVKLVTPQSGVGKTTAYKKELLQRALDVTKNEFGYFNINSLPLTLYPNQVIDLIQDDNIMNVALVAANKEWDEKATAINIPIRGGSLSYRLLLIHKDNIERFENVTTLEQLNKLTAGLQSNWATTPILRDTGAKIAATKSIDNGFSMLLNKEVDYIPRAIYEIHDELAIRSKLLENIVIAPNIALYVPMVSYFYVSHKSSRLAHRLTIGLTRLLDSGEMKEMFDRYYAKDIQRANIPERHIIEVHNDYFDAAVSSTVISPKLWALSLKN